MICVGRVPRYDEAMTHLSRIIGAFLALALAGCAAGIPKETIVPSGKSGNAGADEVPPENERTHFDDPYYRNDAFQCAREMNSERNRLKAANALAISSGVLSLTSALISGILAAQTTASRTDAADRTLFERPEIYAAGFSFLTALTSATSPFLVGSTEAAQRHARMAAQWEAARKASKEMERIHALHRLHRVSDEAYGQAQVDMRDYIAGALLACRSTDPPAPEPLPLSLLFKPGAVQGGGPPQVPGGAVPPPPSPTATAPAVPGTPSGTPTERSGG